jgi:hypothetical protein
MTLDELFAEFTLTDEERKALVWRLVAIRSQRLVETLLPQKAKSAGATRKR